MGAPKGNKFALGNRGGKGGPPKYHINYAKLVALAIAAGHTEIEVANLLCVSNKTLWRWKIAHKEFATAVKTGRGLINERVVHSLYQRALGYDHNGKHYPPDVAACIWYLKNRMPEEWKDRHEQRHTVVEDNRTAAEILADLQRQMAEMGLDLVPRDDGSFALPPVLPQRGRYAGRQR
jgi:hypothetical protein